MKVLLDTSALLFAAAEPARLSPTARALLTDASTEAWVSAVSAFEAANKHRIGKLDHFRPDEFWPAVRAMRLRPLPVSPEHALFAGTLPSPHRDPFDRLLAAQATIEGLVILGADPAFDLLGVETVW